MNGWSVGGWHSGEVISFRHLSHGTENVKSNRLGSAEKTSVWARIKRIALTDVGALMRGLNAQDIENLERVLIEADFGVSATVELTQALEDEVRRGKIKTEADLKRSLQQRLVQLLDSTGTDGAVDRAES